MSLYHEKLNQVKETYDKIEVALAIVADTKFEYDDDKNHVVISIFNEDKLVYTKEAILNVYWNMARDELYFKLVSYPNSDVPFRTRQGKIDIDEDGMVTRADFLDIAENLIKGWNK